MTSSYLRLKAPVRRVLCEGIDYLRARPRASRYESRDERIFIRSVRGGTLKCYFDYGCHLHRSGSSAATIAFGSIQSSTLLGDCRRTPDYRTPLLHRRGAGDRVGRICEALPTAPLLRHVGLPRSGGPPDSQAEHLRGCVFLGLGRRDAGDPDARYPGRISVFALYSIFPYARRNRCGGRLRHVRSGPAASLPGGMGYLRTYFRLRCGCGGAQLLAG